MPGETMAMRILQRLEGWLGRLAIPHLTAALIVAQAVAYVAFLRPDLPVIPGHDPFEPLTLIPSKVLAGEPWRLITFLAVPPTYSMICLLFGWYLFYLMGTALDQYWGTFRYNIFLFTGWVATVAASFIYPDMPTSGGFLAGSVFLAFAHLNPSFTLYIFFVVPIEIRWLALITWLLYGSVLAFGAWAAKLMVLAAVANFLLFFGPEIFAYALDARRRMANSAASFARGGPAPPVPGKTERRCVVCGLTTTLDPSMEFRFCSKCEVDACYCSRHLRDHEHVLKPAVAEKK
jgi:hypothetical protein